MPYCSVAFVPTSINVHHLVRAEKKTASEASALTKAAEALYTCFFIQRISTYDMAFFSVL
jgi:hypothetical protein